MKNCKNCPFDPDKKVIPFSNGTEAMDWTFRNCEQCLNYGENDLENDRKDAKCKAAWDLDLGFISGDIPLESAKFIGCEYDPLYGSITLYKKCRGFNDENDPIPF